jgi:hypothetical protein
MRLLLILLMMTTAAIAAPIPKSLKGKRPLDITGMWKLVAHNSNGKPGSVENMIRYWKMTDESFEYYTDPNTRQGNAPTKMITPDPDIPDNKLMHGNCPCRFERNGDRMVWVYTTEAKTVLDNCEAGPNRYQYVFELVK